MSVKNRSVKNWKQIQNHGMTEVEETLNSLLNPTFHFRRSQVRFKEQADSLIAEDNGLDWQHLLNNIKILTVMNY